MQAYDPNFLSWLGLIIMPTGMVSTYHITGPDRLQQVLLHKTVYSSRISASASFMSLSADNSLT